MYVYIMNTPRRHLLSASLQSSSVADPPTWQHPLSGGLRAEIPLEK